MKKIILGLLIALNTQAPTLDASKATPQQASPAAQAAGIGAKMESQINKQAEAIQRPLTQKEQAKIQKSFDKQISKIKDENLRETLKQQWSKNPRDAAEMQRTAEMIKRFKEADVNQYLKDQENVQILRGLKFDDETAPPKEGDPGDRTPVREPVETAMKIIEDADENLLKLLLGEEAKLNDKESLKQDLAKIMSDPNKREQFRQDYENFLKYKYDTQILRDKEEDFRVGLMTIVGVITTIGTIALAVFLALRVQGTESESSSQVSSGGNTPLANPAPSMPTFIPAPPARPTPRPEFPSPFSYHPLVVTISNEQYFGRELTDAEKISLTKLMDQKDVLVKELDEMKAEQATNQSDEGKETIKEIKKALNNVNQQIFLSELEVRYEPTNAYNEAATANEKLFILMNEYTVARQGLQQMKKEYKREEAERRREEENPNYKREEALRPSLPEPLINVVNNIRMEQFYLLQRKSIIKDLMQHQEELNQFDDVETLRQEFDQRLASIKQQVLNEINSKSLMRDEGEIYETSKARTLSYFVQNAEKLNLEGYDPNKPDYEEDDLDNEEIREMPEENPTPKSTTAKPSIELKQQKPIIDEILDATPDMPVQ